MSVASANKNIFAHYIRAHTGYLWDFLVHIHYSWDVKP